MVSDPKREALRKKCLEEIPAWYSPTIHLAIPSLFGLSVILVSIALIKDLRLWELLTVPVTYLLSNLLEWLAHRNLLHKRNPIAPVLYDRHTPVHHMIYKTDDMALRELREFRLILIPAYGILLVFLVSCPLSLALYFLLGHNAAFLFNATSVGYVVGYEWLHLSYHLPADHPVGKLSLIKKLRAHHATHHNPDLMQKWNLNVTVPIWDWILGTWYS